MSDAAERPDEGEHRCKACGLPDGPDYGDPHECPPGFLTDPAPVGEPLCCTCGHGREAHIGEHTNCRMQEVSPYVHICPCWKFTPAPLSSPRRTRGGYESSSRDVSELAPPPNGPAPGVRRTRDEGAWEERIEADRQKHPGAWRPDPHNWWREGWLAGFRAARLAGEEDR